MNFTELNLNNIIAIDDDFINKTLSIKNIPQVTFQELLTILGEEFQELSEAIEDNLQEESEKNLEDIINENMENINNIDQLNALLEEFFRGKSSNYDFFYELSKEGIKLETFHPSQVNTSDFLKEKLMEGYPSLFVIDRYLGENLEDSKQELRRILQTISEIAEEKDNFYLFIYTSEVKHLESYEELLNFLTIELSLATDVAEKIALHINFVDKGSMFKTSDINLVLRKSQKANFINAFKTTQEITMRNLSKKIWEINSNELLIHYNYLSEGQHIDEILYDIYIQNYHQNFEKEKQNHEVSSLRKTLHGYIELEKHGKIKSYTSQSRIIKELNKLFKKKSDSIEFHSSDDVSFGDVIKINNNFYMVCTQQCDLVIRVNGLRKNSEISLLPLSKMAKTITTSELQKSIIKKILELELSELNDAEKQKLKQEIFSELSTSKELEYIFEDEEFKNTLVSTLGQTDRVIKSNVANYTLHESYTWNKQDIIKVPAWLLDFLLLPFEATRINVSKEIIENYSEVRYSTKIALLRTFEELVEDVVEKRKIFRETLTSLKVTQDMKETIESHLLDLTMRNYLPDLKIEFILDGLNVKEIRLHGVRRIERLELNKALELFDQYISNSTRIGINDTPYI